MNGLIHNNNTHPLAATPYGLDSSSSAYPLQTDSSGKLLLAQPIWQISGNNVDVRNLTPTRDTIGIQGSDIPIRSLTPSQDFVTCQSQNNVVTTQSGTVPLLLAPLLLLVTDMSNYSNNTFWVRNTGVGIAVSITLQLSPINTDAYYVNDQAESNLLAGGLAMFRPSRMTRFARLRIVGLISLNTTTVTAYHVGQTDC